uniref:Uncharacterized protein n=1 Tax=Encephalitozoon cuniculi TaxID=6035 RepID=M1JI85_ENCCN|nr:hypothetical protein ECU08_1700 [Encephalitozoon cuniculi]
MKQTLPGSAYKKEWEMLQTMGSAAVICMLVGAISGFTISSKTGIKRYLVKGEPWKSPDLNITYKLTSMSASGVPAEFQTEEISPGIKIIKEVGTNDVLDLHHPKKTEPKLMFYGRNNGARQKFEIEGDEKSGYHLKNSGKCLQYDETGNIYGVTCSSNPGQKFDIVYSPEDSEYKPLAEEASIEETSVGISPEDLDLYRSAQVLVFNEEPEHKHKHSHHHNHIHKHRHNHAHEYHHIHPRSSHKSTYFTYQRYPEQIIV